MPIRTFGRSPLVVALNVLVFLQTVTPAWAWGRLGHRVISRLAEHNLTPAAKAAIAELLESGESLADASLWVDENRGRLPNTVPWPYADVPLDEKNPNMPDSPSPIQDQFMAMQIAAVTRVRREMGIDSARALLGHSDADMTTIYADRDQELARHAKEKLG